MRFLNEKGILINMSWLIPEEGTVIPRDLHLRLDSIVFLYSTNGSENWVLREIYGIKGLTQRSNQVGEWSENEGLIVPQPYIYERRKNLSGISLTNGINEYSPICTVKTDSDRNITAGGFFGAVYNTLQNVRNISLKGQLNEFSGPRL